ncbi:MAG: DNA methyltransferase [Acidobacteriota bacterium]|nr:DNA methyltransferase [Acidobacteriota bacterium]
MEQDTVTNPSVLSLAASDVSGQVLLPQRETRAGTSVVLNGLRRFSWGGRPTQVGTTALESIPTFTNEFWTRKQRAGHSLHEVSYRACFKPQLVDFFVQRLTVPGDVVYDPFMGRGTTIIEAALLGRRAVGCDVNPLSVVLTKPRLSPPMLEEVEARLAVIDLHEEVNPPDDLTVFYHPETLQAICALRKYLGRRRQAGTADSVDEWIEMVAVNRLTGHSRGFFSVYTLPPNQAVSVASQVKINARRAQIPPRRDVASLILRKTRSLLRGCDATTRRRLAGTGARTPLLVRSAARTDGIRTGSVDLVVTSPPFLDVVDYATDNWLRWWFCGIEAETVPITIARTLETWRLAMKEVFLELQRVVAPGGYVAFEVGDVKGGTIRLEDAVVPCGMAAGLEAVAVVINDQFFTKTANCWGVSNNRKGTNTNRIVLFRKPE